MNPIRYTLVGDGPSDRCLLQVINFVLGSLPSVAQAGFVPRFAEPGQIAGEERGLAGRMARAVELFPCDVLFVHRDAEREDPTRRVDEILRAAAEEQIQYVVPVVPVRMTEAWLLIDVVAIRRAADNPNGTVPIVLPRPKDLEGIADPKEVLFDLLVRASEKSGRRLEQFKTAQNLAARRARVANLIQDFSGLTGLNAFRAFRADTIRVISQWGRDASK